MAAVRIRAIKKLFKDTVSWFVIEEKESNIEQITSEQTMNFVFAARSLHNNINFQCCHKKKHVKEIASNFK